MSRDYKLMESLDSAKESLGRMNETIDDLLLSMRNGVIDNLTYRMQIYELATIAEENHDYKKACEILEKAILPCNYNEMYNCGVMYFYGHGIQKNIRKAKDWYEKAAQCGSSEALLVLGCIHYMGEYVPENIPLALEMLQKAQNAGEKQAENLLEAIASSEEKITIKLNG